MYDMDDQSDNIGEMGPFTRSLTYEWEGYGV